MRLQTNLGDRVQNIHADHHIKINRVFKLTKHKKKNEKKGHEPLRMCVTPSELKCWQFTT